MKLTLKETAELLGYNPSYFTNRRKQVDGFGPPSIQDGNKTLFDFESVVAWAMENARRVDDDTYNEFRSRQMEYDQSLDVVQMPSTNLEKTSAAVVLEIQKGNPKRKSKQDTTSDLLERIEQLRDYVNYELDELKKSVLNSSK